MTTMEQQTKLMPVNTQTMITALTKMSREVPRGASFLRMDKSGQWLLDGEPVETGTRVYIDPNSIGHGKIAWAAGACVGQNFAPISQPLPDDPNVPLPPNCLKGWEVQFGLSLRFEDNPAPIAFRSNSLGGRKAVAAFAGALARQMAAEPDKKVAVAALGCTSYDHKTHGIEVFEPQFDIEEWISLDDLDNPQEEEDVKQPQRNNGKTAAKKPAPQPKSAAKKPAGKSRR